MKNKSKKSLFVLQVGENYIKAAKFLISGAKKELSKTEIETIPFGTGDKSLSDLVGRALKKLDYAGNPIIISLPRNLATCRFIKVPAHSPEEIEKIVSLQASRYLPYPAHELITGYEMLSADKEGFSGINLIIAHKTLIGRYINIFNALKPEKFNIFLSSLGLSGLYSQLKTQDASPAMLIDIDSGNIEVAVIESKKLTFSRNFKLNNQQQQWQKTLLDEINRTRDAYLKEFGKEPPSRIFVFGTGKPKKETLGLLAQIEGVHIEQLPYNSLVDNLESSFAGLIGLGLADTNESLNLLPEEIKTRVKTSHLFKDRLRLAIFIGAILITWILAYLKTMDNKSKYLARLKDELNKITKEAKPLEDIEKRVKVIKSASAKKVPAIEILHELNKIIPEKIYLNSIIYEDGRDLTLRGQAQELSSVLVFVAQLEGSAVFKKFNVKIRYATKKKIVSGEIVDFEIACLKR